MNRLNKLLIFTLFLLSSSCSKYTYTQLSVGLDEAVNKGNVLVELSNGRQYRFKNIEKRDSGYVGTRKGSFMPLIQEDIKHIKLGYGKINSTTIFLNDRSKLKGYLHEVLDSAVVLSFKEEGVDQLTIDVRNIRRIYVHKSGTVGKGYVIGTATGMGIGLFLSTAFFVQQGSDYGVAFPLIAITGTFGIFGSLAGVLVGAIASGKNFDIYGSIKLLTENREELTDLSYIKE